MLTDFQRTLDISRIYRKSAVGATKPVAGATLPPVIRVLSWNIGRGHRPDRIAAALRKIAPDIACLQEVDWGNARTDRRDVTQYLCDATGMMGLFGIEFLELPSSRRPTRFAGGGATGNAILTRLPSINAYRIELPSPLDWEHDADNMALPWSVRRQLRRETRIGRRFCICAEFANGQQPLVACSTHFEDKFGGVYGRWSQYQALAKAIDARAPASTRIVAGDFNTFDGRLARLLRPDPDAAARGKPAGITEAAWWTSQLLPSDGAVDPFDARDWTFSFGPLFRAKLDWITVRGGTVEHRGIGSRASSDHRPLWADIRVRDLASV